jgi:cytochrome P450
LPQLAQDWLGCLSRWQQEYGDVVWLPMPPRKPPAVLLSLPDYVERVLVSEASLFRKAEFQRRVRVATGDGLFTSEGEEWRRQRRFLQPHLQRTQIAHYADEMVDQALKLAAQYASGSDGEREVFRDCLGLALRVVARTLFGLDLAEITSEIGNAFEMLSDSLQGWANNLSLAPTFTANADLQRMRDASRRLDALVYRVIADRQAAPHKEGRDLLSRLIAARDEEDGSNLDAGRLRDQVMTMLIAGSETIALALAWALYLLATHPEALARLRDEVNVTLGTRPPRFTDLSKLSYTDSVIRETLRLYPPTWLIGRAPIEDWSVAGYHIPCGTSVLLCPYLLHRDPRFFLQPDAFCPERWSGSQAASLPRLAYFPFGGGQRGCVGSAFAMQELALVLATVAARIDFTPIPDRVPRPLPHFTLRPERGIQLRVARRLEFSSQA